MVIIADHKTLLHFLRNPDGCPDDVMHAAQLQAADEIERLLELETYHIELFRELHTIRGTLAKD